MTVLRIAYNYLRDQRWPVAGLLVYAVGMMVLFGFVGGRPTRDDLMELFRQQSSFAVLLGVLLAGAAINADLRTRRLLGILSKAVRRDEYLGGVVVACWAMSVIYAAILVTASVVIPRFRIVLPEIGRLFAPVLALALLSVCAAVMFGTFVHPFFATALAAVILSAPGAIAQFLNVPPEWFAPGYELGRAIVGAKGAKVLPACASALAQATVLFAIAAVIFSRKDIAVTTE
jgi:hypothetical protein